MFLKGNCVGVVVIPAKKQRVEQDDKTEETNRYTC